MISIPFRLVSRQSSFSLLCCKQSLDDGQRYPAASITFHRARFYYLILHSPLPPFGFWFLCCVIIMYEVSYKQWDPQFSYVELFYRRFLLLYGLPSSWFASSICPLQFFSVMDIKPLSLWSATSLHKAVDSIYP